MSKNSLSSSIAALLIVVLIAPTLLFAAPQKAQAGWPTFETNPALVASEPVTAAKTAWTAIKDTLIEINTSISSVAAIANDINTFVLQPLAFVLSGQLMKALTASVMKFVIGKANGTGIPQFAVDVQKSLRSISDAQKYAYLRQIDLSNSPFASSVAQALGINYNQNTSLAGYWAANMNTLGRDIPTYRPGFLSGNWSQGGTAAWFQLTTQSQNNPYTFYANTTAKFQTLVGYGVGGSSALRMSQLNQNQGFMSWCSSSDTATKTQADASTAYQACMARGGTGVECQSAFSSAGGNQGSNGAGGINPGDPCTKSDGTPGTIQTPGSTIKATLDKVLGGQQDKLVQMGNISGQVNQLLSSIGTIMNTINLAANILGGDKGNGLLNAAAPNGALTNIDNPTSVSSVQQTALTTGYGTSASQLKPSASVTAAASVSTTSAVAAIPDGRSSSSDSVPVSSDMSVRAQQYQTAWDAIALSANETLKALQTMRDLCQVYPNAAEANAAQNAISNEVSPVLTQVTGIQAIVDAALAQYNLVQSETSSSPTYANDLQKLNTMPPTVGDTTTAQYDATAYGGAKANPVGSLTVSGSSIVDQMNLIRTNALGIQNSQCTVQNTGT